jgi:hypothetical protein
MSRILARLAASLLLLVALAPAVAHAQLSNGNVVSSCGTPNTSYGVNNTRAITQDTTGLLCTGATFTGSITVTNAFALETTQVTNAAHLAAIEAAMATQADVNLKQIAGVNTATGAGTAAGALRVELPTDGTGVVGISTNTGASRLIQATASAPITSTSATTTLVVAASGSTKVYVMHYDWVLSGAGTVALIAGTGATCGGGTHYLTGASGHTASFAANGGISAGSGLGPILVTAASEAVCIITTGAVDTAGSLSYAQF